jgi:hypothetical protein
VQHDHDVATRRRKMVNFAQDLGLWRLISRAVSTTGLEDGETTVWTSSEAADTVSLVKSGLFLV